MVIEMMSMVLRSIMVMVAVMIIEMRFKYFAIPMSYYCPRLADSYVYKDKTSRCSTSLCWLLTVTTSRRRFMQGLPGWYFQLKTFTYKEGCYISSHVSVCFNCQAVIK